MKGTRYHSWWELEKDPTPPPPHSLPYPPFCLYFFCLVKALISFTGQGDDIDEYMLTTCWPRILTKYRAFFVCFCFYLMNTWTDSLTQSREPETRQTGEQRIVRDTSQLSFPTHASTANYIPIVAVLCRPWPWSNYKKRYNESVLGQVCPSLESQDHKRRCRDLSSINKIRELLV